MDTGTVAEGPSPATGSNPAPQRPSEPVDGRMEQRPAAPSAGGPAGPSLSAGRAGEPRFHFTHTVRNADPMPTGGTALQQTYQAALLADGAALAAASEVSGHRLPIDWGIRQRLEYAHDRNPTIGSNIAVASYSSSIAGVPPTQVFNQVLRNLPELFAGAAVTVRPELSSPVTNGARAMLIEAGPPPAAAPVEIEVDPRNQSITFHTLDGHPLRGFNRFQFQSDGHGGTRVVQYSEFQASSTVTNLGADAAKAIFDNDLNARQVELWESFHRGIFNQATR